MHIARDLNIGDAVFCTRNVSTASSATARLQCDKGVLNWQRRSVTCCMAHAPRTSWGIGASCNDSQPWDQEDKYLPKATCKCKTEELKEQPSDMHACTRWPDNAFVVLHPGSPVCPGRYDGSRDLTQALINFGTYQLHFLRKYQCNNYYILTQTNAPVTTTFLD